MKVGEAEMGFEGFRWVRGGLAGNQPKPKVRLERLKGPEGMMMGRRGDLEGNSTAVMRNNSP